MYSRIRNTGSSSPPSMALLIQRLVRADASGVAFTINPVTRDGHEVLINSIKGLGERFVSGSVNADEWIVRQSEALCKASPENAISKEQAVLIANLAKKVESHFKGKPQDIEWVISGDKLFLLQARQVTMVTKAEHETSQQEPVEPIPIPVVVPEGYWTMDREHFPRPLSPMFVSYSLDMYREMVRQMTIDLGLPFDGLDFKIIGGWGYGRIIPPGGKDRKPPPRWMMKFLVLLVPSIRSKVKQMKEMIRNDTIGKYIETWRKEWKQELVKESDNLSAMDLKALSDDKLDSHLSSVLQYVRRAKEKHFRYLAITILDIGRLGVFCQDHLRWDALRTFDLLSGFSEKDSESGKRLEEITALVRDNPMLIAAINEALQSNNPEKALSADKQFSDDFSNYMKDFGVATLGYDVMDPTLNEMPAELLKLILGRMKVGNDPGLIESGLEKRRMRAEEEIDNSSLSEEIKSEFRSLLKRARLAYALHDEETFYTQNLCDGITRYVLLELGTRLAARNLIQNREDVFMLTMNEARKALKTGSDHKGLVKRRIGERMWALANQGPPTYGTPPPPPPLDVFPIDVQSLIRSLNWSLQGVYLGKAPSEPGRLSGTPASPGSYEGSARIVEDEAGFGKLQPGDILVCPSTSPSWSVVFPIIGALVTEAGGVLSHPAIVAREYGIPAVLSVEVATKKLRDGQKIRVDGEKGIITVAA